MEVFFVIVLAVSPSGQWVQRGVQRTRQYQQVPSFVSVKSARYLHRVEFRGGWLVTAALGLVFRFALNYSTGRNGEWHFVLGEVLGTLKPMKNKIFLK